MARWVLDQWPNGPLEYPTLGFNAEPGDILIAGTAPDPYWSLNADQGAAETVYRYALGSDPNYVEPVDGHVLTWSDADNTYVPTAPETVGLPSLPAYVADLDANPASAFRVQQDARLSATYVASVNPKKFGAVGDGTTDDTAAVQDALDALATFSRQGGTITFPQGTFRITAPLLVTSENIAIRGGGHRNAQDWLTVEADAPSTLYNDHAGPLFKLSHTEPINGFNVSDITLQGNNTHRDTEGHAALDFDLGGAGAFRREFSLTRVTITRFSTAIMARATSASSGTSQGQIGMLRVTDCNIMHNRHIARCLNSVSWNGFHFHRNDAGQNGYAAGEGGLQVQGHSLSIQNNVLEGQRDPIKIGGYAGRGLVIRGNYFEACVGEACIDVGAMVGPVDIGPNFFGSVTTTKVILRDGVRGKCVDPWLPNGAVQVYPRPGDYANSQTDPEHRLSNTDLTGRSWIHADRPQVDDLAPPRQLGAWAADVVGVPVATRAFIPAKGGLNVPVTRSTLATDYILNTQAVAGASGKVLVAVFAFRCMGAALGDPYIVLAPNGGGATRESPVYGVPAHFRANEWIVATFAMLLTAACTSVDTYLRPYGYGNGVGDDVEYLPPTIYVVDDVNDVKPWLARYGKASAVPSSGTGWDVGDEVVNHSPAPGGALRWVYSNTGAWKAVNLTA